MDISDDKMNVYKDLARKCESFELFKWIVGDKESWMTIPRICQNGSLRQGE